jgi:hypothetical protein
VWLAILVYGGSLFDALLALGYLQDGGGEANPLMDLALAHSTTLFLGLKIGLTGAGVWGLAAHQQWPLAVRGLHALVLGYGMVVVYHLVLTYNVGSMPTARDGKGRRCTDSDAASAERGTRAGCGTRGLASGGQSPCGSTM